MIESEFANRVEALDAMSGRSCDSESIDEGVIDELGVTGVCPRMPRHVVGLTYFLRHRAIIRTHPCRRIAGHSREVSDDADRAARHLTRARNIGMHYHV